MIDIFQQIIISSSWLLAKCVLEVRFRLMYSSTNLSRMAGRSPVRIASRIRKLTSSEEGLISAINSRSRIASGGVLGALEIQPHRHFIDIHIHNHIHGIHGTRLEARSLHSTDSSA